MIEMTPEERLKQIWKLYQQLANTKGQEYERTWQEFSEAICDIPRMLAAQAGKQPSDDLWKMQQIRGSDEAAPNLDRHQPGADT